MGRNELFDWIRSLLKTPAKEYRQFAAGLSFLGHLSPKETCDLLRKRRITLEGQIEHTRASMNDTLKTGIHRIFLVETDYELTLLVAELKWLDQLINDIENVPMADYSGEKWIWSV